jgi:hypothetical protein
LFVVVCLVGDTSIFPTTATITSQLGDISTRGFVQTADNVMIGGFVIEGTEPKTVIVRAIGPELTQFGVTNVLADPTLELHDGTTHDFLAPTSIRSDEFLYRGTRLPYAKFPRHPGG